MVSRIYTYLYWLSWLQSGYLVPTYSKGNSRRNPACMTLRACRSCLCAFRVLVFAMSKLPHFSGLKHQSDLKYHSGFTIFLQWHSTVRFETRGIVRCPRLAMAARGSGLKACASSFSFKPFGCASQLESGQYPCYQYVPHKAVAEVSMIGNL